ncbi:MAG: Pvc16 family protein [Acidobacteria bacterium]|nr:Pvc16 family protein [Acidobacteriota bacterium]
MLSDLDATLTAILDDSATPTELRNAEISFEPPDRLFNPPQATVNLFLYEVLENRVLRDPVPIIEKIGGVFVRRQPPLRADCSYMITSWGTGTGPTRIAQEHRLLSQALLWLSRFPIIPDRFLQGSLVNPPFPHPTMVAQMNEGRNLGEFWTALGQSPRPSFNLLVTIAMDLGVEVPEGPPVITKDMRLLQKDKPATQERWFQIGGTVFEAFSPPSVVSGAQVRLVERRQTAVTDDQGRFTFTLLLAGNYTLEVSKAGFTTTTKSITVPGASLDAYDVVLVP